MRNFFACMVLVISTVPCYAAGFDVFPSTAEAVGTNLPTPDLSRFNKRLATEVIDRFDFKAQLQDDVHGKIKSKFLDYSAFSSRYLF